MAFLIEETEGGANKGIRGTSNDIEMIMIAPVIVSESSRPSEAERINIPKMNRPGLAGSCHRFI